MQPTPFSTPTPSQPFSAKKNRWQRSQALYEARWIFLVLALCWLGSLIFLPILSLFFGVLILFCGYFFRDPERIPPIDPNLIVAPADGIVTAIEVVDASEEDPRLGSQMQRISIFLSIFDVHINRSPIEALLVDTVGKGGLYLDARKPESSWLNESLLWLLCPQSSNLLTEEEKKKDAESARPLIAVKQITGAIARRIVAWKKPGEKLARGERFGMIRFGSRTEIYLPMETSLLIHPGEKVFAGQTPLAKL